MTTREMLTARETPIAITLHAAGLHFASAALRSLRFGEIFMTVKILLFRIHERIERMLNESLVARNRVSTV